MASMSISGVVSGMDWESMIDSIIESAAKPAQVQVNKRTNLQNKKTLFEEMKVSVNTLQSSLSTLKLPSTYKAKEVEIERIDTSGSYKGVLTATVNADAEVNVYELEVKQLARSQVNRSNQITASTLKNTLGSIESSKIYINAGNQKIGIDVYNTDSLDSLKSRINTTLKTLNVPLGITASVVDNKLILKTDSTGLGTTSVTGTAKQRYDSTCTDLGTIITDSDAGSSVNIYVDESNAENVTVKSGGKSYSIHKDYEIVNNQIRWKQYEDTDNVKLGETVKATYVMGEGDVYTKTAKRGTGDSDTISFGLDVIDEGTLSQRMKIKGKKTTSSETETSTKDTLDDGEKVGTTTTEETEDDGTVKKTTVKITKGTDDDGNTVYTVETTVDTIETVDFKYGKDFTFSNGKITWLEQEEDTTTTNEPASYKVSYSKDTSVDYSVSGTKNVGQNGEFDSAFDADELIEAYKNASGSELSTLTLTGSDGVIRTYLDPTDRSLFKLTDDDGTEYEYGRDYVIRVSDDGGGYVVSWLATDDTTGDGTIDINDANVAVTAYIEAKNISTLNFNTAPDTGMGFELAINVEQTKDYSADVKSSDEDKKLSSLFKDEDLTLTDSEYSKIKITDSNGKEYTYADVASADDLADDEFAIIDGEIVWKTTTIEGSDYEPNEPDKNSEYTIYYESFAGIEAKATSNGEDAQNLQIFTDDGKISGTEGSYLSYEQILGDINSKLTAESSQDDVDEALKDYFSITDADGNTYTYGDDFIIKADEEDSESEQHKAVIEWVNVPANGTEYTVSYTGRGEIGGEVFTVDKAVTRSNSDVIISGSPVYSDFKSGTATIIQGTKTFYEGTDFEVGTNDDGNVLINWKTGTDYEWYYPTSGSYTVNLTTESGETKTYTAARSSRDTFDLRDFGFSNVSGNGTLKSITYGKKTYDLTGTSTDSNGKTDSDLVKEKLGINLTDGTNGGVRVYDFNWTSPLRTTRDGLPNYGDEISIEYEYNTNTFTITDDGDGVADLLGLNSDITEAQNAILVLDGEEIQKDLNNIGESYGNELIKGMTLNLKGVGKVSLDVSHDAEKAVESIQTFVDNYNDLMSWMNTRMSEKEVDEDTKATIDSDDFRMRWGLLHGNSLLRNTKSQMRDTVSQNFTFSFTERKSTEEIYGSMSFNGLRNDSTLRLRINSTYVDVPVLTTDTIQDIAAKINDSTNPAMRNIFYGDDGKLLDQPLLKAKIEGDKLVINSTSSSEITMSGSAAMNALKMNYTYKGVFQLGIATTSDNYGQSGELEFDTDKFMEALEDNPEEVQSLMLKFVSSMDTWTKSMINSSASGQTSGTLTRQISDIETQISSIDEYLEKYQDRLDRMEESLRSKYAAAEQQISKLTQQASAISSILQQLSGNNNSNNNNSNS